MLPEVIVCSLLSYLYGAVPYAWIATSLLSGKNLAEQGTGNIGVTNTFKVGGYAAGTLTVAGEISKALLPLFLAHRYFSDNLHLSLLFAFSALIGTSFSIFLKGKGGKGSTLAIWSLLFLSPCSLIILCVLWIPLIKLSRGNSTVKRIPLIFIPTVIFMVERDVIFSLFGILTGILFLINSCYKKDDFVEHGIFH